MLKPIRFITVLAALGAVAISAVAQPALKVATIDLTRAYEEYWRTQEHEGKLYARQQDAQSQVNEFQGRIQAVLDEVKALDEESKSTMLTQDARDRKQNEARQKFEDARSKEQELRQYVENTQRSLQQQRRFHQELMLDDIKKVVNEIGAARGATLILDTSGPTAIGLSSVVYHDPEYDITGEVITKLNESKPADFKAPVFEPSPETSLGGSTEAPAPAPAP